MPPNELLAELRARGLVAPAQATAISHDEQHRPFSLHYEVRTLLYLGIVLLTSGLGVLLYQNLDAIGHGVVMGAMVLLTGACFAYAAHYRTPFTWNEAPRGGFLPAYVLLLGCLLFLSLEGYAQYQYQVFGTRYGLALAVPAVLFFGLAYRFDHRGVLALAITALASWVGVSVAPLTSFSAPQVSNLSGAAVGLGLGLLGVGLLSEYRGWKRHFSFTYLSLASNLTLLAATAAMFDLVPRGWLSLPIAAVVILVVSSFLIWYARRTHSYLFLLLGALYSYLVVTYLFFRLVDPSSFEAEQLAILYFPLSVVAIITLFRNIEKIVRGA